MSDWGIGIGNKADRIAEKAKAGTEAIKVVKEKPTFLESAGDFLLDGVQVVASFLVDNYQIFVIVGMVGMMFVIIGKKDLGKKLTSGSFWGYIIARVVEQCLKTR